MTDLVIIDAPKVLKGRISPKLQAAMTHLVHDGMSIVDAAEAVGMARESLSKALKKPHVKAAWAGLKRAWMENRTAKAWHNVADLADSAQSEDVRLKANRTFLEAAGELGAKDAGPAQPSVLINILQQFAGLQPPTERLPGVIEAVVVQGVDDER